MSKVRIYCLDNSDLTEVESKDKGYRNDIYVCLGENYYKIYIYDIVRLQQDFETEFEEYGFYSIDPNLILVNEVSNDEIIYTIEKIVRQQYFEKLKPLGEEEVPQQLFEIKIH